MIKEVLAKAVLAQGKALSPTPRLRQFKLKILAAAAVIALAVTSNTGSALASPAGNTVQQLYGSLLVTMKSGSTLGQSGRYAQLAPVIRRSFDLPVMARLSVGPTWSTLTPAQQQQVTDSYGRYVSAIYADRFDGYHGQKLQVTSEQPTTGGVLVHSTIIKADGDPVQVDYMMRQEPSGWLISDIYLDGSISEVATRRSEFSSILRSQGIDGLVAALNRKADILTGTAASARSE